MSPSHLLTAVHLILIVAASFVLTASTAPLDSAGSSAPHVITWFACFSSLHNIYYLLRQLRLGFSNVYSRSVNYDYPQAFRMKPSAGVPHLLQETLPFVKLVVRASNGIDETRSSSDILGLLPTSFVDVSDEFRALPRPSRVALCSAVDSYSDENGIRVTSPITPLYTVAISPRDFRHSETYAGKCCRLQISHGPGLMHLEWA
ncbi:unnamed protein product [Eruca vesicaria subsp. sativa]|uniref:Uncharacterized protein n=1 Tax=Eruca vesicaria subsp. sativa TaxID=29727 RepID=A0ABC8LA05_ERUVS|nr:unnamed protein product [Eruca vesicaria subsp. sativa]